MNKKVLIFGISGFVGSYLAEEFNSHGYEVYGSDIARSEKIREYVNFSECDILDGRKVSELINSVKPTHIVDLAAISSVGLSWKIPQKTVAVNVEGTLNILEAAKEISPRILLIGSSEEYAVSDEPISESTPLNANNPYGISKIMQEEFSKIYRERYGMKIFYVRAFNHTGVGQSDSFVLPSFCKQVAEIGKSGKPGVIKVGNLSAKRDFSHVKDIVRAYRTVIESDDCETVYNIGSGMAHGLDDILNYILKFSRQNISVEIDPERFRPVDTPIICCDNSLIREKLGWTSELSVFDALREMVEKYEEGKTK